MKAFHDSRIAAYRFPYGAVEAGSPVTLRLDVCDAPGATVQLRTWTEGQGEGLFEMQPAGACAEPARVQGENPTTYQVEYTPGLAGVVWYHFIITDAAGNSCRYGARDGRLGGEGELRGWEPPSFKLTAFEPGCEDARAQGAAQREVALRFLRGEASAFELAESLESLRENLSGEAFGQALGLLGEDGVEGAMERLSDGNPGLGKGRLWCLSLIQLLSARRPALWQPATEGGEAEDAAPDLCDPEAVPGGCDDADCEAIMANTLDLHRTLPPFAEGRIECFAANGDIFGFWRADDSGAAVCVLVNASLHNAYDVAVPLVAEEVSEVTGGYGVPVKSSAELDASMPVVPFPTAPGDAFACAHLYQLGTAVLLFHPARRLQEPLGPGLGVLAHVTSLPSANGQGTLGSCARDFLDWLAAAGVRYWQVLPVNPTDEHGSPYAGISAFAGNTRLLDEGVTADELVAGDSRGYRDFCEREADWLEPYAAFMAIRGKQGPKKVWQKWPKALRRFDPAKIEADAQLSASAEEWRRKQFAFHKQWMELRSYANARGVKIVGDMPIYVSADSSDVWANPQLFQLDAKGMPGMVAGCPPDSFAQEGQVWGNPVYDWDALRESGYAWWLRRLERAFELYDIVRLDHFIGFARYFSIPAGGKAVEGSYRPGPGLGFFQAARDAFGPLPIIAEDLGSITPAVRALVAACGFPGMDIVQFVDGNDPLAGYLPRPGKIAYTGTHDNQTLRGYVRTRYPGQDEREACARLARSVAECPADVAVLPLQDLMGLDDEARMNTPGTTEGNWVWQADAADMAAALKTAASLVSLHEAASAGR